MENYCAKCETKTENLNPNIFKTKNSRIIMQSNCTEWRTNKLWFVQEQAAKGLRSNLEIKIPFSKTPLLNVFFWVYKNEWNFK